MKTLEIFLKLVVLQMIIITSFIVVLTIVRFFDYVEYRNFISKYSSYASYDTSTELVYEGK